MKRVQIPMRHFFATPPAPCPYIDGRMERKVVTLLTGDDPDALHDALSQAGFRRSQDLAYRPACEGCSACVPVRVRVAEFTEGRRYRRIRRRNEGVVARVMPAVAGREHYELFRRYLEARHTGGGMANMGFADYRSMIEETPVDSHLVEYRRPGGALYAVCLTDRMSDGLSLVYSFFDPDMEADSPGSYIILRHIEEARRENLPYVYLGYWIAESAKMSYKARFRPLEGLRPEGWRPLDGDHAG
ncbi:arginyltransferase [Oceanibacterium hippocampi]|uniref:Aspartate/glutamate leucyltransferase n=1 Tax=Oceanibacterium hippocampi TaxID=745714 RepID=A0A1Y5SN51_9PROT|nr:arginyltransferase [Oceanibacterium hippocampi]SLN44408.1 arginyl-tRNA-protein transferase [Oceanibacterium hippocampi]